MGWKLAAVQLQASHVRGCEWVNLVNPYLKPTELGTIGSESYPAHKEVLGSRRHLETRATQLR